MHASYSSVLKFHTLNFSDKMAYAKGADPDQTAIPSRIL